MKNESQQSLHERVVKIIHEGKVSMRPKWHFVLHGLLFMVGVILLTLSVLYVVSFIIFMLYQTGVWFAPRFGLRGLYVFLVSLPWLFIGVAVVFLLVLEVLVRRYAFAYRRPLIYFVVGIFIFVIVGGFIIAKTSFHRSLYKSAQEGRLPFKGMLYRDIGMKQYAHIHHGMVTALTLTGFDMQNHHGEKITVIISRTTRIPVGIIFTEGDFVVVLGEVKDGSIRAYGVQKMMPPPMPFHSLLPPPR